MSDEEKERVAQIMRRMSDAVMAAWERKEGSVVIAMDAAVALARTIGVEFKRNRP